MQRNFVLGKMNKSLDERLVPNGEYVDALNIRLGSTEDSEVGSVENTKGNLQLTSLQYNGVALSADAKCIGAYADGANETIYWFVHDPSFSVGATGKLDMVVSYNANQGVLTQHIITLDDGTGVNTTLNFNPQYLITGVNLVDETLLYWTDDYNPPRQINVDRSYPQPVLNIDQVTAESLLVIKRPPNDSVKIEPTESSSQENFLEDRFVCFGYRYRYEDGEYSATSQFSPPSFIPRGFDYDFSTGLNSGMLNSTNFCEITYNSGGPLVVGIDLLWKDMQTGNIRVIEKLDKDQQGLVDNTDYTYTFSNSKIFTVLPDSEILRLYDNVPRLAKAQTVMGNRLVYGNYVEQYDLLSLGGFPTRLDYVAELVSEEIGLTELETSTASGSYSVNGLQTINNSVAVFEGVGAQDLKAGSSINFEITFRHKSFTGDLPFPTATTQETFISFGYILPQDFASAHDLATSVDFIEKIGTILTIQTVPNACTGTTFTDIFNCAVPGSLGSLSKYQSGVNFLPQPIVISSSPGSDDISLQLPAMQFVDDPTGVAITQRVYEYYEVSVANASFQVIANPKSLHSNRSYEVGIVYMDEFNRATTALTSRQNTVGVPCSASDTANKIRVTIPPSQIAPSFATRYKFVIKPDKENYFTIYSPFFFRDPITGADYFLLEGQNARKVEEGDILIVKADSSGPMNRCAYATVLEKKAQQQDFLDPAPEDSAGNTIKIPAGVYMKIRANDFDTTIEDNPTINYGIKSDVSFLNRCPLVPYLVSVEDETNPGTYIDYEIPSGSRITIFVECERIGKNCTTSAVEQRFYSLDVTLTAQSDYSSFKDWWDGDNVESILNGLATRTAGCGEPNPQAFYDGVLVNSSNVGGAAFPENTQTYYEGKCVSEGIINMKFGFFENTSGTGDIGAKYLVVQGFIGYKGKRQESNLKVNIQVQRADSLIIFETLPQDALPDVWYESSESYPIDQATGLHEGNVQNQSALQPAIIDTAFFNCYAFGNGVESYRIRDSIDGKELLLGNRVTTTSAQDYREIRRDSDLTYSGVYNDETNVNKLNEFNLGLLNFKPLEETYGPIFKLDGRKTDILVLQEDKISYVLAGKNLLTDSTGESTVTSVPEVLGTQVARTEEYGISFHPESYADWGYDKFFTDVKRSAVIQLRGSSANNEQLNVISNTGMASWFRDSFIESFDTQKLGAYDPYMQEYVLSSNDTKIPREEECLECGILRIINVQEGEPVTFCVDVGQLVGDVNISYNPLVVESQVKIDATYNGVTTSTGFVNSNAGSPLIVNKNVVAEDTIEISIETNVGAATLEIGVGCPVAQEITIIQVCVSNNADAGQFIHNEYRWQDGAFISPLHSEQVELASGTSNPLISQYTVITGPQGAGYIPADGATVSIISNRILPIDDFIFQTSQDELKYLRTSLLYNNTPGDIQALLAAANLATPITQPSFGNYQAAFIMPSSSAEYLYLIYDYRNSVEVELCFDSENQFNACCLCTVGNLNLEVQECRTDGVINTAVVNNTIGASIGDFVKTDLGGCVWEAIGTTEDPATGALTGFAAGITDCAQVCETYEIANLTQATQTVQYVDCFGVTRTQDIIPNVLVYLCARSITENANITATRYACDCNPGDNSLLLRRCVDQTLVYAYNDTAYSVGEFVVINGQPDCVYEIIDTSTELPSATITSLAAVQSCVGVCVTFQLENTTAAPITVSYTECEGAGQTIEVPANDFAYICAQEYQEIAGIVGTFYACGCNPPQNLFLAQRCGDETQIVVDEGGLVVNVGDFVELSIEPDCVYEIISLTTGAPVAFVQTILGVQNCNEVCKTFIVDNATQSTQTLSYVDCAGSAQTADILAGQAYYICARSVTSNPELTVTFYACGCDPVNFSAVVRRCGDGQIVTVYNNIGAVVGDFVTLDSSRSCIYEVISLGATIPTDTIATIEPINSCDEVCNTWVIVNSTQASVLVDYVDCSGIAQQVSIIAGGTEYVCARTVTQSPNWEVTFFDCGCNPTSENLLVQRCGDSLQKVVNDTGGTGAVIGDFVILAAETDCVYQVIANSTQPAVSTISAISVIESCNDVCSTYSINNPDVSTQNVSYVDCSGVSQVEAIPAGETWYICARTVNTGGTSLVSTWYDCGCNLPDFSAEVTRCGDGQVVTVYNGVGANIGDIVSLQGIADCLYQVTALSTAFPTESIDTITQLQSCAEVCSTWRIDAGAQASVLVDYIDCNGASQTISVIAGGTEYVCAQSVVEDPLYTVTWVDCGCDLPQNNFIIERCGDGQQLIVADGNSTGATIGDFVDVASQPDCIYEVIAVTSDAAVENINSISLVQDCSEVCSTWSIQNPARTSQTLSYVDCNGVAQTVDIFKEQTWQICARSVDVSGTTLIATWLACGCNVTEFTFEVERCGDGQTEIIYNDGVLTIGDFVGLDDCVYQIIAASNLLPTIETNTQVLINDCDEVCSTWLIENNTAIDTAVNYVDCDGNPQAVEILGGIGVRIYLCARTISEAAGGEYTVSWHACGCNIPNYTYELLLCTAFDFGPPIIAYDNIGTVQLGDLVILDGQPNCRFLVNAPSNQLPTDVIVAIAPEESCDSVCNTYSVEYLSGTGTFTYVSCAGVQETINVPDNGIPVEVCLYSIVNSTEVTVTFAECGCNQIGG